MKVFKSFLLTLLLVFLAVGVCWIEWLLLDAGYSKTVVASLGIYLFCILWAAIHERQETINGK